MSAEYKIEVEVPEKSRAWKRLHKEIPAGSELVSAKVRLTRDRASVEMNFIRRTLSGDLHKRVSYQSVTIGSNLAGEVEFLHKAFPEPLAVDLCRFLPGRVD